MGILVNSSQANWIHNSSRKLSSKRKLIKRQQRSKFEHKDSLQTVNVDNVEISYDLSSLKFDVQDILSSPTQSQAIIQYEDLDNLPETFAGKECQANIQLSVSQIMENLDESQCASLLKVLCDRWTGTTLEKKDADAIVTLMKQLNEAHCGYQEDIKMILLTAIAYCAKWASKNEGKISYGWLIEVIMVATHLGNELFRIRPY
jgi:hypothetical protein